MMNQPVMTPEESTETQLEDTQLSPIKKLFSAEVIGHPLVWSLLTGVLIFVGYLWLQQLVQPLAHNSDEKSVGEGRSSQWNPEIYNEIQTEEEMPIGNNLDDTRADNYRRIVALEAKILPLLEQAQIYFNEGRYVGDGDDNAWHKYRQILDLDPKHTIAKLRMSDIINSLADVADAAIEEKRYDDAESWLVQLDIAQPFGDEQIELRQKVADQMKLQLAEQHAQQIERERLTKIQLTLARANSALLADSPDIDTAYSQYQEVLRLDPGNQIALSGIRQTRLVLTGIVFDLVNQKQFKLALDKTQGLLAMGEDEKEVASIKAQILQAMKKPEPAPEATAPKPVATTTQPQAAEIPSQVSTPTQAAEATQPSNAVNTQATEAPTIITSPSNTNNTIAAATLTPTVVDGNRSKRLRDGINAYYSGNYQQAFRELQSLAEEGVARAQFRIAVMYYQGRTVTKNVDVANQWAGRAFPSVARLAQEGKSWAQSDLGTAYENGIGTNKDMNRAVDWYRKAAEGNYAGAQTNLGVLYGTGDGVSYDRNKAIFWLKKAADQGDKVAADNLSILNSR